MSARIASPSPKVNDEIITVYVVQDPSVSRLCQLSQRKIPVKLSDTVKVLRLLIDKELAEPFLKNIRALPYHKCQEGSLTAGSLSLHEQRTLASYGLYNLCTIICQIRDTRV